MQFKHALARAVTASALAAIVTVGAVGPVHADQGKGKDRSAAAKSAAADRKAEANAEKSANKGQRRNADKPAKAQGGKPESKPAKPAKGKPAKAQSGKPDTRASKQNPRGYGHTPVTVCHLRGNGTYIEITFDENALDAHKNHGDLHPVPAGGCPATADEGAGVDEESDLEQPAVPGTDDTTDAGVTTDTEVAGVDAEAAPVQNEILGVQAEADATTGAGAAAAAGTTGAPANAAAGILPNTGAGQFGLALLAGLGLLAAGAAILARRRPQMSR